MINIATEYIENHGLKFNPHKRICHIMGQNLFTTIPRWYINGVSLDIKDKLTYLGLAFNNDSIISFNITVCCTFMKCHIIRSCVISLSSPIGGK